MCRASETIIDSIVEYLSGQDPHWGWFEELCKVVFCSSWTSNLKDYLAFVFCDIILLWLVLKFISLVPTPSLSIPLNPITTRQHIKAFFLVKHILVFDLFAYSLVGEVAARWEIYSVLCTFPWIEVDPQIFLLLRTAQRTPRSLSGQRPVLVLA